MSRSERHTNKGKEIKMKHIVLPAEKFKIGQWVKISLTGQAPFWAIICEFYGDTRIEVLGSSGVAYIREEDISEIGVMFQFPNATASTEKIKILK